MLTETVAGRINLLSTVQILRLDLAKNENFSTNQNLKRSYLLIFNMFVYLLITGITAIAAPAPNAIWVVQHAADRDVINVLNVQRIGSWPAVNVIPNVQRAFSRPISGVRNATIIAKRVQVSENLLRHIHVALYVRLRMRPIGTVQKWICRLWCDPPAFRMCPPHHTKLTHNFSPCEQVTRTLALITSLLCHIKIYNIKVQMSNVRMSRRKKI